MTVSVIVPWRGGDPDRERAWAYVRRWWAERHPDWQVVTGDCTDGPWVKALAVADALDRADGDLLVIADADVITDGVGQAVEAVESGAPWAIPHNLLYRLTPASTEAVYGGATPHERMPVAKTPHEGYAGGGITAIPRETYERVPLDPRFVGWGSEDEALALALRTLAGRPWRGTAPMYHLHHEPQARLNRHVGSKSSHALLVRYQYAFKQGPAAMRQILDEFRPASVEV